MRRFLALAACICTVSMTGRAAATDGSTVWTAQSGDVSAELTARPRSEYGYADFHVKIVRAGAALLDAPAPPFFFADAYLPGADRPVTVRDLDGDAEPEVVFDLYTGGAHCCVFSVVYRYDAARTAYTGARHDWGNEGYLLRDLDGDGLPELRSGDDRFNYEFTFYAASFSPIQIWRYRGGELTDVTRSFPSMVRKDAAALWRAYARIARSAYDWSEVRGVLAAWLADRYLLGEGKDGWKRVRAVYHGKDRNGYLEHLTRFLARTGYIR